MGERNGKGSKPWEESNDLVRQVLSCLLHFPAAPGAF
jgi:hypothetical protein